MLVKQQSVRSADRYLNVLKVKCEKFRILATITDDLKSRALSAGFSSSVASGDTILPNMIGNHSRFNSEGKFIKRKDLPKEERYVTTVEWSWEQWCGRGQTEAVSDYRDIYRDCYQREFVPPPSVELTWVERHGKQYITTNVFTTNDVSPDQLKHLINLFLELFGECEIRNDDLSPFFMGKMKRLNWEILPPGKYPWEKVQQHVKKLVKNVDSKYSNVILDRQETISSYEPDEIYVGTGGFRAYIAYVFKSKKIVVLESVETGNAIYVFGQDWMKFSAMTKAEILNGKLQKARIIHSKGWESRLKIILSPDQLLAV